MNLFQKLQQRNVFRMAIGYVLACWLLAQVADLVLDSIGAPKWVMQAILLVFALGFPVVVFFSWAYEVTPEGIKRESEIDRTQSIAPITGRKLDRAITVVLIIALGFFVYDKFVLTPQRESVMIEARLKALDEQAVVKPEAAPESDRSIAVLPFVNMSSDKEQDYFSDGLSEELLNMLAKVPDLRVIARTSSFAYKGKDVQIDQVARELNVAHVLEGSVRKSGNQVRITAQLINARDSSHLWSETYDRNLDNIFDIQDEIANRITAALLPQLVAVTKPVHENSAPAGVAYSPPVDVYQRYLLARNLFNTQASTGRVKALETMTQLVNEYPDYAEAQAFYALVVFNSSSRTGGELPWIEVEAMTRNAIDKALTLKPDLEEAYLVEGRLLQRNYKWPESMASFEKAIELNPSYSEAHVALAQVAMSLGQQDRGWQALERARELDPVSPITLRTIATVATAYDRPVLAEEAMALLAQVAPESASETQVSLYWSRDQFARAAVQLEQHSKKFPAGDEYNGWLAALYAVLGMEEEASKLSAESRLQIAAWNGDKELALKLMEELAAGKTDPHDRADRYWYTYYALGMYDEALAVLSDLWYGYAEQTMGPRMDGFDCLIFASLLNNAGRTEEAQPVIRQMENLDRYETRWWIKGLNDAQYLLLRGKLDEAFQQLDSLADKGEFFARSEEYYRGFFGLEKHPDFPSLIAKYEAWRQGQLALYQSLKAEAESRTEQ